MQSNGDGGIASEEAMKLKCPHCNWEYLPRNDGQQARVPAHDFPTIFTECPGIGKRPVNDHNPLLQENPMSKKDDPTPPPTQPVLSPPADAPPKKRRGRLTNNTVLLAMSDTWQAMEDLPVSIKRQVVDWLESQVAAEEKTLPQPTTEQP